MLWRTFVPTMMATAVISTFGLAVGARAEPMTVGFSMPDLSESFWVSLAYGVEDEAKKAGVTVVKLNAGGDANVNQQISQDPVYDPRKLRTIQRQLRERGFQFVNGLVPCFINSRRLAGWADE